MLQPVKIKSITDKEPVIDIKKVPGEMVYKSAVTKHKKQIKYLKNKETAANSLKGFQKGIEIFAFTKGQFSLIELIDSVLDITGPAELYISTWTAARYDVSKILEFLQQGKLTGSKWLVDLTFNRRAPELAHNIRECFGDDSIRICQTHAKFSVIQNESWKIVIRTSMNLNTNPRFEDFTIAHDPELAAFLTGIMQDIWKKQKRSLADAKTKEQQQYFRNSM